jgi:mannose-6-phosphate isomerase
MQTPSSDHDGGMSDPPERRPWGDFVVLSDAPDHKVKRLTVNAGCRLSYQTHAHRSEHWFFVSGVGIATIDGVDVPVGPGSCVDVPVGAAHRVTCTGSSDLVLIEVQHGESFEEDDIVRLDDDYGRMAPVG